MTTRGRLMGFALACMALLGAAGCAVDDHASAAPEWVEPGWMARARQDVEEYQTAMAACLEDTVCSLMSASAVPCCRG